MKRKIAEMIVEEEDNEDDDRYVKAERIAAGRKRTQSENQFDRYYNSLIIIHQNMTAFT